MSEEDERFELALDLIRSVVIDGRVFIEADAILDINSGVAKALDPSDPNVKVLPPSLIHGIALALDLYRRVHTTLVLRHLEEIIPDTLPDDLFS